MRQVWDVGPPVQKPRAVLTALADRANEGGECYPSIALIQQMLCMSKRTVLRALKYLEEEGWIEIDRRATIYDDKARGNLYYINLEKLGIAAGKNIVPLPRKKEKVG